MLPRLPGGPLPCLAQSLGHSLAMGPAPVPLALVGGLAEAALCMEGVCSTAAGAGFRRLQARSQHREVLLPTQGLAHSLGNLPLPDHLGEDRGNTGQVTAAGGSPSRKPPGVAPGTTPPPHPTLSPGGSSNSSTLLPRASSRSEILTCSLGPSQSGQTKPSSRPQHWLHREKYLLSMAVLCLRPGRRLIHSGHGSRGLTFPRSLQGSILMPSPYPPVAFPSSPNPRPRVHSPPTLTRPCGSLEQKENPSSGVRR